MVVETFTMHTHTMLFTIGIKCQQKLSIYSMVVFLKSDDRLHHLVQATENEQNFGCVKSVFTAKSIFHLVFDI